MIRLASGGDEVADLTTPAGEYLYVVKHCPGSMNLCNRKWILCVIANIQDLTRFPDVELTIPRSFSLPKGLSMSDIARGNRSP